jgi:hypothetical protein
MTARETKNGNLSGKSGGALHEPMNLGTDLATASTDQLLQNTESSC